MMTTARMMMTSAKLSPCDNGQHAADAAAATSRMMIIGSAHLLEEPLDERVLLALGQLVFAVGRETFFRLGAR